MRGDDIFHDIHTRTHTHTHTHMCAKTQFAHTFYLEDVTLIIFCLVQAQSTGHSTNNIIVIGRIC